MRHAFVVYRSPEGAIKFYQTYFRLVSVIGVPRATRSTFPFSWQMAFPSLTYLVTVLPEKQQAGQRVTFIALSLTNIGTFRDGSCVLDGTSLDQVCSGPANSNIWAVYRNPTYLGYVFASPVFVNE